MNRVFIFFYGAASYAVFLVSFLYAIGFVGNFAVPKSMDSPADGPWQTALLIDLGLLSLFALQHSVMARPAFKRLITKVVPATIERSTYVLASSLALLFLFWQWKPLGGIVWDVQNEVGLVLLYGGFSIRLGAGSVRHLRDQPFRPVRPPAGLESSLWETPDRSEVCHAACLSDCTAPPLCRLVFRVLEYAGYDGHAFVLRDGHSRLHSRRDSA